MCRRVPLTAGSATHRTPKLEGRISAPDSAFGVLSSLSAGPSNSVTFACIPSGTTPGPEPPSASPPPPESPTFGAGVLWAVIGSLGIQVVT